MLATEMADQAAETAAAFLPTTSLPRGGGALRGMGESLRVNPAHGTASLSIPLAISQGRDGGTPALALTYGSGTGNSVFGLGVSLSIPSISRRTRKGLPRYTDDDVFVLSGSEDLVPVLPVAIVSLTVDGVACRVRRFRPRVEHDLTRVERCRPVDGGADFWRVTSPQNVVSLFGRTDGARVAAPGASERVFEWMLETVADDRGNVTTYTYKREDTVGVDRDTPSERHRLDGPAPVALHPKTVRYGNKTPGTASDASFLVVFDYGEHDQTPSEVRTWPARPDPFSDHRATFEVRTWRLCRRVLMFHDFAPEFTDGPNPRLVRATEFTHHLDPVATTLTAVTRAGFEYSNGGYRRAALPPLELDYTTSAPDATVRDLVAEPVADATGVWWVDLDGDGLPGVLSRTPGSWFYQRNAGAGVLERPTAVSGVPSTGTDERIHLSDVDGSGRLALVRTGSPGSGYASRTDGGWAPLRPFAQQPVLNFDDPRLRRIDLDGDGLPDLMLGVGDGIRWWASLGRDGYGPQTWTPDNGGGEEHGPRLAYADELRAIFLADMSGDGLVDVVRVRNGEVCYWPSLGYGRFGAKVTMGGAPIFDHPERFDPGRVRLGDLDGTGPTDLVYLGGDGVRAWVNRSGNGWGPATPVGPFPAVDSLSTVDLIDLLGTGTACLVWTSALPSETGHRTRYLDLSRGTNTDLVATDSRLAGWKPYLLARVRNNLGATTSMEYAPSTRFSIADRRAGHAWVTRLPFPVHVVASSSISDGVTGDRLVTTYRYRHGCFDGVEREFRGFGMVETRDAESVPGVDASPLDLPAVRTRDWFHVGVAADVRTDVYPGPTVADHEIDAPGAWRDAIRSLAGRPLRTEVYADDGLGDTPISVECHRYHARQIQPPDAGRDAVVLAYPLETLTCHYERVPADPRVARAVTLAVDDHGTVTSSVAIGFPRLVGGLPEQQRTLITWTAVEVTHTDTAAVLRLAVPVATSTYQVTDPAVADPRTATPAALAAAFGTLADVAYETSPVPGTPSRRLVASSRDEYWSDDLSTALPYGQVGTRALPRRSYRLAFTAGLVAGVYGTRADAEMLTTIGGYTEIDGDWWAPSEIRGYDPAGFYAPLWTTSPFGNTASVTRDAYHLFAVRESMSDRPGLTALVTSVEHDYRILAPRRVTDPNGNGAKVSFDTLGLVVRSWTFGHQAGEGDPDSLPGTVFHYDVDAWRLSGTPAWAQAESRERHGDAGSPWQRVRTHSDGFGRVAMSKIQAEPGLAWTADGAGGLVLADTGTANRWIGSGRTVYNNKGLAVEQYEPYFSATPDYESATALVKHDVPVIQRYDALGRLIRTDLPDGTFTRIEFGPWHHLAFDANDTVASSTWYAERQGAGTPPEQVRAAALALADDGTPTRTDTDSLGRPARTTVDNGTLGSYSTRMDFDITGNVSRVVDPRGVTSAEHVRDLLGRALSTADVDTGTGITLPDVANVAVRNWTATGHEVWHDYDALRRPTGAWVRDPGVPQPRLVELTVYGEGHPTAVPANLRGHVFRRYDQAGSTTVESYDFQGNSRSTTRTLATSNTGVDWKALSGLAFAQLDATAVTQLDTTATFTDHTTYDALNRPVTRTRPDATTTTYAYNAAGLVETVHAQGTAFVTGVDYDVRRRRLKVFYGNGVTSSYDYDGRSHRLARLRSTITDKAIQDLSYVYDPVGNIVEIVDAARQTVFFDGGVAPPATRYEYDSVYRLVAATGREHASLGAPADTGEPTYAALPHPNDPAAIRTYAQTYTYDEVGNLLAMRHTTGTGTGDWTRSYEYTPGTSRLRRHTGTGGGWLPSCAYDGAGNVTAMPYLPGVTWDHADRLVALDLGGGGQSAYTYDGTGERVRRVWTHGGITDEYVYLDGFERYRRYRNGTVILERHTSHVSDGPNRVALIETLTVDVDHPASDRSARFRYQLTNHFGSSVLECDETGAVISYEEYHPFGTTALWLARGQAEVNRRRYRYTGKEKDVESGLYYHGARYYAPWLGRWLNPDPGPLGERRSTPDTPFSRYVYCYDSPVIYLDPDGRDPVNDPFGLFPKQVKQPKPFIDANGKIDMTQFPPRAAYNADDIKAIQSTSPDRVLGRLAYSTLCGLMGVKTASAPENAHVAARDRQDLGVGPVEQALSIALFMLPIEKIAAAAVKGGLGGMSALMRTELRGETMTILRELAADTRGGLPIPFSGNKLPAIEEGKLALLKIGASSKPVVLRDLSAEGAQALADRLGMKTAVELFHDSGTIASFDALSRFTAGQGGKYQAHHIVEQKVLRHLGMPTDISPSVILSDAEHKAISKTLGELIPPEWVDQMTKDEIWAAYKQAYKDRPEWLAEVARYFKK